MIVTKFYWCIILSAELKRRLDKVVEEDYKQGEIETEQDLPRMKALLLKIAQAKKFDISIWIEGTKQPDLKDEEDLNLLERANLIKGQTKYTHRNVYRQFELTVKGAEIAEQLKAQT
jgi:hypothetical protein